MVNIRMLPFVSRRVTSSTPSPSTHREIAVFNHASLRLEGSRTTHHLGHVHFLFCFGGTRNALRYNREGDLLFTCGKDKHVCLWFADNGSMIGTYVGHDGSVNTADVTWDSERLLTASADSSVRLWQVETGQSIFQWKLNEQCRACSLAVGDRMAAFTTDRFMEHEPRLHIVDIEEDMEDQTDELRGSVGFDHRVNRIKWAERNTVLIAAHEDGCIRKWDAETGCVQQEKRIHEGSITDMRFASDMTHFITASVDKTAKIIDARSLEVLKIFKAGSPVNAVDMSPTHDHEAVDVAIKGSGGIFESRFYHKIYAEEFGRVKGHFSPINTIAFHPSGRGFVSGSEEGFVRVHKFDDDYFTTKFF